MNSAAVTGATFPGRESAQIVFSPISFAFSKSTPPGFDAKSIIMLSLLTLLSMLFAGALYDYRGPQTDDVGAVFHYTLGHLENGLPFAASMLAILLAHEFGHYFMARRHDTQVSLPYYLPFPFSPFGTLGAFINLKETPKNRRVLLDIGLGGPFAGLLVAIPILFYGLMTSTLNRLPLAAESGVGLSLEGNSLFYLFSKWLVFGKLLPEPAAYDVSPLWYWIRYLLSGQPLPWGALDVHLNAIAWAGWAGLLVTAGSHSRGGPFQAYGVLRAKQSGSLFGYYINDRWRGIVRH